MSNEVATFVLGCFAGIVFSVVFIAIGLVLIGWVSRRFDARILAEDRKRHGDD